ncbi:MAG: excinuclease ABC subunit UvrA [Psychroflexus sp.]|nr:excinuclease ABC subunit UvrA [Psychroflexus sp.]
MKSEDEQIQVFGAREHNLQNIDIDIPRNQLVVITGLSGSGKSSLAFDTIYAEGQRRYIETFSAYARQFLGGLERPDVDKIEGLSPVIAIEQKTTSKSPRSTVGTITEIYDFLRLLYARAGTAYSYKTGEKMVSYTDEAIRKSITKSYLDTNISILAPVVRARKGHYRELFEQIARKGYLRVRVDGELREIEKGMKLDRYKTHDIEIVVDRLKVSDKTSIQQRLASSIATSISESNGTLLILKKDDDHPRFYSKDLMCPTTGISYPLPEPNLFSFNSPKGACPKCNGIGYIKEVDTDKIIPNRKLSIQQGGIEPHGKKKNNWLFRQLENIAKHYDFSLQDKISSIPEAALDVILNGGKARFKAYNDNLKMKQDYSYNFEGVATFIKNTADQKQSSASLRRWANNYLVQNKCPKCDGSRLKKESLHFKINEHSIDQLVDKDIDDLYDFIVALPNKLSKNELKIAKGIIKEIKDRLGFLKDVGLTYLSLNRGSKTLSGGEAQRIRLATQIGSQLVGVLYILDEPSIGLHQRDNERLINSLKALRDLGNTVIVVEHDEDMINSADHVIDIGPAAGKHGGKIISQGQPKNIDPSTLTGQYLLGKKSIPIPNKRRKGNKKKLTLKGATGNNLKSVDVQFPLGTLIGVTGVSGSGKSTLINNTLYPILNNHFFNGVKSILPYQKINGLKNLDKVIDIDQAPIGRTPRSNPVTYTGVFSEIRNLFAKTPEASIRGYKPGRFSFNVKGGRCETCSGGGVKVIEMSFLPDVYVECETCMGKRFNRETLEIRYKGKSISDVLEMNIEEATAFFEPIPKIYRKLQTLEDVGLGYITLGQQSTTLSGGEAQRVKLATELSKRDTGQTFYILDEPTTGLHFEDIRILMEVLNKLVDRGNTVLIIEHNLDVIKQADYVIDMGLEGGKHGGELIAKGTPEAIVKKNKGYTAAYLKKSLS